jgi:hypothetical protein
LLLPFRAAAGSLAAQATAFRHRAGATHHHAVLTAKAARKAAWLLQFFRPSLRSAVTAGVLRETTAAAVSGLLQSWLAHGGRVAGAHEKAQRTAVLLLTRYEYDAG